MRSVAFNSVAVSVANACVHIANYVVIAAMAAYFGVSWQTDAFFLAFSFPAFFVGAIVSAVGAVFVPVFVECKINKPSILGRIIGSTLLYVLAVTLVIALLIALIAGLISQSRMSFGVTPEFQQMVSQQIILLLPVVVIQPLTGVITAFYNSNGRLLYPPVTDAISTLAVLVVMTISRQTLGIYSVPLGFLSGALLHLILLIVFWPRFNVGIDWSWKVEPELRRSLTLALPLILGTAALQFGSVIARFLAARLPEGSVTILDYASRIAYGIMEILTSGVLLVILAKWSKDVLKNESEWLKRQVKTASLMVSFIVMPVVGIAIAMRVPLVAFAFQRGNFDIGMTIVTSSVLVFYLLGIPIDAISRIYVRLFLVWQNTYVIGSLAVIRVLVTTAAAVILMQYIDLWGIALADTLAICLIGSALFYLANQRLGNTFSGTGIGYLKIGVSSACAGGIAALTVGNIVSSDLITLLIGGSVGSIIYLFVAWLLRIDQLGVLVSILIPRLSRRFSQ